MSTWRRFQSRVLVLLLGLRWGALAPLAFAQAPEQRPANLLVIVADDLACQALGCYGNRQARTPHIDQLAASGLRLNRAFCNSPVCTASRQSLLTGRYPRSIGVTQLATPLPESTTTLAEMLAAAGYRTAALGKMHFNSDRSHGFQQRVDLGDYPGWLFRRSSVPLPPEIEVLGPWHPFRDPAAQWLNARALPYAAREADMASAMVVEAARLFLYTDRGAPFLLWVSFFEPHSPFHFPIEYAGRHRPDEFTAPPVEPRAIPQIPRVFADLREEEKRGIAAAYQTSVEYLDANIGRLMGALESAGRRDDTLVVLLGDHGYLLGQHGRFEKHCCYEEAIRVPLLLSAPGRIKPGSTSAALVELIDMAPTLLEWAGVAVPDELSGRSLWPLAEGRAGSHRERVVVEYAPNEEAAIRDERWKLVYRLGQRERTDGYTTGRAPTGVEIELFDLENDPAELVNLAGRADQRARVEQLKIELAEHLIRTARRPERLPEGATIEELLAATLVPDDVEPKAAEP